VLLLEYYFQKKYWRVLWVRKEMGQRARNPGLNFSLNVGFGKYLWLASLSVDFENYTDLGHCSSRE